MKKYWHELSKKEQEEVKLRNGYTVGEFLNEFSQPDWCSYPEALESVMGCWALFFGDVHDKNYCRRCECFIRSEDK